MKSKYPFNEDERPLKSRTKEELGSSYGSGSSRSPRGSLENNKNIKSMMIEFLFAMCGFLRMGWESNYLEIRKWLFEHQIRYVF